MKTLLNVEGGDTKSLDEVKAKSNPRRVSHILKNMVAAKSKLKAPTTVQAYDGPVCLLRNSPYYTHKVSELCSKLIYLSMWDLSGRYPAFGNH